jgi:hypothetical protein
MTDTQEDFALAAISVIFLCLVIWHYESEIWAFMDWCMTTTENFHRRQ